MGENSRILFFCIAFSLGATALFPPVLDGAIVRVYPWRSEADHSEGPGETLRWGSLLSLGARGFEQPAGTVDGRRVTHQPVRRIYWPLLFGEQALILLLGGALLTRVVRRERRRRGEATLATG